MHINIYCDESCHLLNDHIPIMTLGAIQYPQDKVRNLSLKIKSLKKEYNCNGELKWTKVSIKNISFYFELVNLFFSDEFLHFRSLIVHNKENLNHDLYNTGDHNNFYYKMYYELLRNIIENKSDDCFQIYVDIKDTQGFMKVHKLHEVLSNKFYDFNKEKVSRIQQIRSHESNLLQISDFLLGAITYVNRDCKTSVAKLHITEHLKSVSGYNLTQTTPPWEEKFNLFHFSPKVN